MTAFEHIGIGVIRHRDPADDRLEISFPGPAAENAPFKVSIPIPWEEAAYIPAAIDDFIREQPKPPEGWVDWRGLAARLISAIDEIHDAAADVGTVDHADIWAALVAHGVMDRDVSAARRAAASMLERDQAEEG